MYIYDFWDVFVSTFRSPPSPSSRIFDSLPNYLRFRTTIIHCPFSCSHTHKRTHCCLSVSLFFLFFDLVCSKCIALVVMVLAAAVSGCPTFDLDFRTKCQQLIFVTASRSENLFGSLTSDDAIVLCYIAAARTHMPF